MKYYTPLIEEFHVGFEFEYYLQGYNPEGKAYQPDEMDTWKKSVFDGGEFDGEQGLGWWTKEGYESLPSGLQYTRVKVLDQDDIEAEGWSYIKDDADNLKFKIADSDRELQVWYRTPQPSVEIKQLGKVIFWGTIRNRSELRLIMKMLGIYDSV